MADREDSCPRCRRVFTPAAIQARRDRAERQKMAEGGQPRKKCEANGSKCTICGGLFDDGEDICGLGQHEIGMWYDVMQVTG